MRIWKLSTRTKVPKWPKGYVQHYRLFIAEREAIFGHLPTTVRTCCYTINRARVGSVLKGDVNLYSWKKVWRSKPNGSCILKIHPPRPNEPLGLLFCGIAYTPRYVIYFEQVMTSNYSLIAVSEAFFSLCHHKIYVWFSSFLFFPLLNWVFCFRFEYHFCVFLLFPPWSRIDDRTFWGSFGRSGHDRLLWWNTQTHTRTIRANHRWTL